MTTATPLTPAPPATPLGLATLREDVAALDATIARCEAERTEATAHRDALLRDGADLEALAAAQARLSALQDVLAHQAARRSDCGAALARAEQAAQWEATFDRLAELARTAMEAHAAWEAARQEAAARLAPLARQIVAAQSRLAELREAFLTTAATVEPTVRGWVPPERDLAATARHAALLAEVERRGGELSAVLALWGVGGTSNIDRPGLRAARLGAFEGAVNIAVQAAQAGG
ncbi:MAG TPA: hypothetical protein VFS40_16005 [Gemmatimonadales bacterium]|nr:hypothetical protein [Gemmatimonadales bacterium]